MRTIELEARLTAIAGALPDPIFIINENGLYEDVIGGSARNLYDGASFLKGKYLSEVLPSELADRFLSAIKTCLDGQALQTIEYQLSSPEIKGSSADGPQGPQWFEARLIPLQLDPEKPRTVLWLAINITERKQLELRLKELSFTDDLTGIYNRRFFMKELEREFHRSKRYHAVSSVLIMDADHFKRVNDTFGHLAGDEILRRIATLCENTLRKTDTFARYGGEEFIAALPNTAGEKATVIGERLREEIESTCFSYKGEIIRLTLSIGISAIQENDESFTAVLQRADGAVYEAKRAGRNQVVLL